MDHIRILIVDDNWLSRAGIRSVFEDQKDIEVVGEAELGEEGVEKAKQLRPDVVLMDIAMQGISGIEATRRIKQQLPDIQILILSVHDDEEFFFPALRAGASGYVLKEAEPGELIYAARVICKGQVYFSPAVAKYILEGYLALTGTEDTAYNSLTEREKEVLQLVAARLTNRQIALKLFLSPRTVEKHRQAAMRKLGLGNREELVTYALRKGLLDSPNDKLK